AVVGLKRWSTRATRDLRSTPARIGLSIGRLNRQSRLKPAISLSPMQCLDTIERGRTTRTNAVACREAGNVETVVFGRAHRVCAGIARNRRHARSAGLSAEWRSPVSQPKWRYRSVRVLLGH